MSTRTLKNFKYYIKRNLTFENRSNQPVLSLRKIKVIEPVICHQEMGNKTSINK